jgi:DNA-binding NarL/FixJ family response regulator
MARLLLGDDQELVRKNIRTRLLNEGIVEICGEATTGRQAIQEAQRLKPDIVVLDQSLPDLTGIQTAYEIRQLLGNVKIVFFTVHDEAVMSSAAHVVGADAFVSKTSFGELVLALRRLMENRESTGLGGVSIGASTDSEWIPEQRDSEKRKRSAHKP